jgi:hypothetical protein
MQTVTESQNSDVLVSKDEALALWPQSERPTIRTLDRYIADGKIRKAKFHNGRVKLHKADVLALLAPDDEGAASAGADS